MAIEREHQINNVPGRMLPVAAPQLINGRLVYRAQVWKSQPRDTLSYGPGGRMQVTIRFDDECANGHQTFSITAEVTTNASRRRRDIESCGCLHKAIARVFPELKPLIKWHLCSTDGPMHYIANTVYLAGDRDHNRLRAGETRQIINGRTGLPCWVLDGGGRQYFDGLEPPENPPAPQWKPLLTHGVGKVRELDAARKAAIWPEVSYEVLCLERPELTALLEARLPALIADFREAMESCGFLWEPTV